MSPAARKSSSGRKPPASVKGRGAKPKVSREMREAAEQDRSRAEALEALYRPAREAATAELEKKKSGRKLLEEAHTLGTELAELFEGTNSGEVSREEAGLLARERLEQFHKRYGDELVEAQSKHVDLQPSVRAVVEILRPETAGRTTWIAATSPRGSMLLQPKATPDDVASVGQGLGEPPPPAVQSCITAPYDLRDNYLIPALNSLGLPGESRADATRGVAFVTSACFAGAPIPVDATSASAFVGHDFAVPPGPTRYDATISYDWDGRGYGSVGIGLLIVNVDLAVVIDKRDGTRETHAREVSLLTIPFFGWDSFHHSTNNARITIPFSRDGSNGTVRIMAGADAHCVALPGFLGAGGGFFAEAKVREICLSSR